MNEQLTAVLEHIKETYQDKAMAGERNYLNVDIGKAALALGFRDLYDKYLDREVVVVLKKPLPGMKVRIDGRTFVNYAEYARGRAFMDTLGNKDLKPKDTTTLAVNSRINGLRIELIKKIK